MSILRFREMDGQVQDHGNGGRTEARARVTSLLVSPRFQYMASRSHQQCACSRHEFDYDPSMGGAVLIYQTRDCLVCPGWPSPPRIGKERRVRPSWDGELSVKPAGGAGRAGGRIPQTDPAFPCPHMPSTCPPHVSLHLYRLLGAIS